MPGLDFIKRYQTGGGVSSVVEEPAPEKPAVVPPPGPVGKAVASKSPYALPIPTAPISVDESILERMQQIINEREAKKNSFAEAMRDAQAWWSGGIAGPGQALAQRAREKEEQEATTFGMRRDLAQYRMAQKQAELDQQRLQQYMAPGQGAGAGAGATAEIESQFSRLTPEAQMRVRNARNATEALAIIEKDLENQGIARGKGMFEAAGNKPEKYFVPGKGYIDLTPNEYLNLPEPLKRSIREETYKRLGYFPGEKTAPAPTGAAATTAPVTPAPVAAPTGAAPAAEKDVYRFENLTPELIGKLRETERAIGLPGTLFDRPDAAENFNSLPIEKRKAAFEYKQTTPAAAPAAAPKVTAPPPPVGGAPFIGDMQATSELPQFTEPKPDPKDFSSSSSYESAKSDWEKRRDAALEVSKKFQEQIGGKSAESFGEAEKRFVTLTDQPKLAQREQITNQLDAWLKRWGENPRVVEILSKPTFANAVADALAQGVQLSALGTLSVPGIERILQASMPGIKGEEVTALKQLSSIMGPRILQIVEQSKGSSSDKDWAAFNQIAGSANTGYDFLHKAVKYDRASLAADKADRSLYNGYIKPGKVVDYRSFAADPRRNQIYNEYQKEVQRIAAMKHERIKAPPRPAGMPKNVPAQYSPSTNSYWIGNTEYKVSQ